MMDLLLDVVLVLWIVRVYHLDRLPPPPSFRRISTLKREARQQRRQCETLGVHTRLDNLLAPAHGAATDEGPGSRHRRDPETEQKRIPVLRRPVFRALEGGLVGFIEGFARAFAFEFALLVWVVRKVVVRGGTIGGEDGWEDSVSEEVGWIERAVYVPVPEPVEATRKARKGTVRALKLAYRRLAPATATPATPRPIRPPIVPPLTVALSLR